MSVIESRIGYEDCYEVMDKALDAKDGIRIGFANYGEAHYFRQRMNKARLLDRRFNKERYEPNHIKHGKSEYDALWFRLLDLEGLTWVYAERRPSQRGVIEEINNDRPEKQTHRRTARGTPVGLPTTYSTKGYRR